MRPSSGLTAILLPLPPNGMKEGLGGTPVWPTWRLAGVKGPS